MSIFTYYVNARSWLENTATGVSTTASFIASSGRAYPFVTDSDAVRADWTAVGDDLRLAMSKNQGYILDIESTKE